MPNPSSPGKVFRTSPGHQKKILLLRSYVDGLVYVVGSRPWRSSRDFRRKANRISSNWFLTWTRSATPVFEQSFCQNMLLAGLQRSVWLFWLIQSWRFRTRWRQQNGIQFLCTHPVRFFRCRTPNRLCLELVNFRVTCDFIGKMASLKESAKSRTANLSVGYKKVLVTAKLLLYMAELVIKAENVRTYLRPEVLSLFL